MRRTQRWTPDTHAAVFDIEWDDEDANYSVCIKAVVDGVEVDSDHQQSEFDRILAENQEINVTRNAE